MAWVKTILREIFGLFVDDGSFAVTTLVWVAAVWLLATRLGLPASWAGIVLFAGLAAILVESTVRRARK